ncbi:MAG: sodium:proton antiporter [Thermoplasmataceae archaeon]
MVSTFAYEYYQISFVFILAAFAIPISRKLTIAYIPILILLGIVFGPMLGVLSNSFSLYLMSEFGTVGIGLLGIVIILYSESHHIDLKVLRSQFFPIAILDTLGITITALIAAILFSLLTGAPFIIGFIFGAIISPTDPASLIPIFRRVSVKEDISGTLIGESLFNDPLGIILFTIALAFVASQSPDVQLFNTFASHVGMYLGTVSFLIMQIAVPSVIGVAIGFSVIYLNKYLNFESLIVGLMLGIVILEFTILEASGITPFPAIIATGAIVGNFNDKSIFWSREAGFQENLSFLSQSIIFLLLGSILTRTNIFVYWEMGVALALGVIFVARPAAVFSSLSIFSRKISKKPINNRTKLFISLVGPRGVVSVVLSTLPLVIGREYNIPLLLQYGQAIYVGVSFIVIISIILQTIYTPFIANRLTREGPKI